MKFLAVLLLSASAQAAITIPLTCANVGTQGSVYAGCSLAASGGTGPYTYNWLKTAGTIAIPEGLSLDPNTGYLSGTVTGQGAYGPTITVRDSTGATLTQQISIYINAVNPIGRLYKPDSIFYGQNINLLPVDTSPAAPVLSGHIQLSFGANVVYDGGFAKSYVSTSAPNIGVSCVAGAGCYANFFSSGPFSSTTPIEGTQNNSSSTTYISDGHAIVIQGGPTGKLFETYNSQYIPGSNTWQDISNYYADMSQYALTNGAGSSDAAGLPIAPFLADYDQLMAGTQGAIRFTLPQAQTLNYHVWPATTQAGGGACSGGYVDPSGDYLLLQSNPPTTCSSGRTVFGEFYRVKASVVASPPNACLTNFTSYPQSARIFVVLATKGMIMADNGNGIALGGTADNRWNDTDLQCLTSLQGTAFEPVNVSSLIISQSSAQVVTSTLPGPFVSGTATISGKTQ